MGEMLKEFVVGLSFGIDEKTLSAFNKGIAQAAVKIAALSATVQASAAGIFYGISKVSSEFEDLGYSLRLIAPPITKVLQLRQEMMRAYASAGIDLKEAVRNSVQFNFSLAKTKYALEALTKGTALRFLPMLTKQMDIFRGLIYANMPRIQQALEKFINFIFKAFEATLILGQRVFSVLTGVWDFFKKLDDATNGWSTIILGVVAAWKLLNLSFLATPLGLLITGLTTLFALYDDFKTFQEGGQSLFDWGKYLPVIDAFVIAFGSLRDVAQDVWTVIKGIYTAFVGLFSMNMSDFASGIEAAFGGVLDTFTHLLDTFRNFGNAGTQFGGAVSSGLAHLFDSKPLGSDNSSSSSTQNISLNQTNNIHGVSDAKAAAGMVSTAHKESVNDVARYMGAKAQ